MVVLSITGGGGAAAAVEAQASLPGACATTLVSQEPPIYGSYGEGPSTVTTRNDLLRVNAPAGTVVHVDRVTTTPSVGAPGATLAVARVLADPALTTVELNRATPERRIAPFTGGYVLLNRLAGGPQLELCVAGLGTPSELQTAPPSTADRTESAAGDGYWMLGADGVVHAFGAAPHCGGADTIRPPSSYGADLEPFPNGEGYWVLDGENYVDFVACDFDTAIDAGYHINAFFEDRLVNGERPVSLSALPDGSGYWVFTDQGRALPFGDAQFYGDMGGTTLNGRVLDSVATPTGRGYWMVASDGGIFSFGDARFFGSMGGQRLNQPVMSMAPDPDGRGYWLVASDGGIFAFDAPFVGSMGDVPLNRPVSGLVASPTGGGYLMVAEDGGAFTFGDVPFHGSLGDNPPFQPITSIAVRRG